MVKFDRQIVVYDEFVKCRLRAEEILVTISNKGMEKVIPGEVIMLNRHSEKEGSMSIKLIEKLPCSKKNTRENTTPYVAIVVSNEN